MTDGSCGDQLAERTCLSGYSSMTSTTRFTIMVIACSHVVRPVGWYPESRTSTCASTGHLLSVDSIRVRAAGVEPARRCRQRILSAPCLPLQARSRSVGAARLELARPCGHQTLNLARLPFRHAPSVRRPGLEPGRAFAPRHLRPCCLPFQHLRILVRSARVELARAFAH